MSIIAEIIPKALRTKNSQNYSLSITDKKFSVYKGELTPKGAVTQLKKLRDAFPNAQPEFFDIVIERVKAKGFTDQRFHDAVNNLIDTFKYPQPTVADVVGFDKRVDFKTYEDMCDKAIQYGKGVWDNYEKKVIDGHNVWINIADVVRYGL